MTSDLFAAPLDASWKLAFKAWLDSEKRAGRIKQDSMVELVTTIWGALERFALAQRPPLALSGLTAEHLERFIASRSGSDGASSAVTPRHAWRILQLVGRVLADWAAREGLQPSTVARDALEANPDWRYANAASKSPLPEALDDKDAKRLVNYLSESTAATVPDVERTWQMLRNRSAVALHLGAGLTPADVRSLTLASVVVTGGLRQGEPWKIRVPAHGAQAERDVPIAAWAARLLGRWLEVRKKADIAGEMLFPSQRTGDAWTKVSHWNAVVAVLEAAGVSKGAVAGGAFRLRHTFALRQLRHNKHPPADVAGWLGVSEAALARSYRHVLSGPVVELV